MAMMNRAHTEPHPAPAPMSPPAATVHDLGLMAALQDVVTSEQRLAKSLRERSCEELAALCDELISMAQSELTCTKAAATRGD